MRLVVKEGALWQRYPAWTYLVWVVSLVVNGALGLPAVHAGMHADARRQPVIEDGVTWMSRAAGRR